MQVVQRANFKAMRWPNGGGVAHEVFAVEKNGKPLWRLSLAEVTADCVFSKFIGMVRNTTVVSGDGMDLVSASGRFALRPLQPVAFSGELPLTGRLVSRAVENLNMVFDSARLIVDVRVIDVVDGLELIAPENILFALEAGFHADGVALGRHGVVRSGPMCVEGTGQAVLMTLAPV